MLSKYLGENIPLFLQLCNNEGKKIMPVMHSCDVSFILVSCSEEQGNTVPNSGIVQPLG